MTSSPFESNQLANATSPYLQQHADNPVHWQIWNTKTLAYAKSKNKPILLSIGYSACHWCHVMAHESFENEEIAALMNANFVNVKVDREERPDIDQIYMAAIHAMGEQGGWPLTAFLMPDGTPYWGGTYFPPKPAFGRPGFPQVLEALSKAFHEQSESLIKNTDVLRNHLSKLHQTDKAEQFPTVENVAEFQARTLKIHDTVHGGVRGAPKFPNAPILESWARAASRPGGEAYAKAFLHTLRQISNGGIYDHLAGGIARYCVDERWLVPHFEKMLYDNAHYLRHLTFAHKLSPEPLFRNRIEETINWLVTDMKLEHGVFASSMDADSEGEEGKFYVWTREEIADALGENSEIFCTAYDISDSGNWEGKNILNRLTPETHTVSESNLAEARSLLLSKRNKRIPPDRDDKYLTDWNAYLIRALTEAGRTFGQPRWINLAKDAFHSITESESKVGDLYHSGLGDRTGDPANANDLGSMINAALSLYEVCSEPLYISHAQRWKEQLVTHFSDSTGGFYLTSDAVKDVPFRASTNHDEANPSAASQILEAFIRMSHLTGTNPHAEETEHLACSQASEAKNSPFGMVGFFNALDSLYHHKHIQLIGSKVIKSSIYEISKLHATWPITMATGADFKPYGAREDMLKDQSSTAAIVCQNQACTAPISETTELEQVLDG